MTRGTTTDIRRLASLRVKVGKTFSDPIVVDMYKLNKTDPADRVAMLNASTFVVDKVAEVMATAIAAKSLLPDEIRSVRIRGLGVELVPLRNIAEKTFGRALDAQLQANNGLVDCETYGLSLDSAGSNTATISLVVDGPDGAKPISGVARARRDDALISSEVRAISAAAACACMRTSEQSRFTITLQVIKSLKLLRVQTSSVMEPWVLVNALNGKRDLCKPGKAVAGVLVPGIAIGTKSIEHMMEPYTFKAGSATAIPVCRHFMIMFGVGAHQMQYTHMAFCMTRIRQFSRGCKCTEFCRSCCKRCSSKWWWCRRPDSRRAVMLMCWLFSRN